MEIRNINDLAVARQTTVERMKHDVHEYTDYDTVVDWNDTSVTLTTTVPEANETESTTLRFPFDDDDFYYAIVGLQCWADYVWCKARQKEV